MIEARHMLLIKTVEQHTSSQVPTCYHNVGICYLSTNSGVMQRRVSEQVEKSPVAQRARRVTEQGPSPSPTPSPEDARAEVQRQRAKAAQQGQREIARLRLLEEHKALEEVWGLQEAERKLYRWCRSGC